jgi:hypothetical protein
MPTHHEESTGRPLTEVICGDTQTTHRQRTLVCVARPTSNHAHSYVFVTGDATTEGELLDELRTKPSFGVDMSPGRAS